MNLKNIIDKIFNEEKIPIQSEIKKIWASQSIYFLYYCFKLKVLYNKEACDKNVWRHWLYDEFIGNSLKRIYLYSTGKLTKEDIIHVFMSNLDNNLAELKKIVFKKYKDLVDKNDFEESKLKKLAYDCYDRFADYYIANRNNLKNITREDYEKLAFYILDKKEGE